MKTTVAVSDFETETTTETKRDDTTENADGLPELVVDTDATATGGAKSTGVGSTNSLDSGLAGDHSSPEHEPGYLGAARSNRRRPQATLKMPAYPGFEWVPNHHQGENGYYTHDDKFSPMADGQVDADFGMTATDGSHVVYVHVNMGETLSVRVGDDVQHIPGPATVRMVTSRHTGPPAPLPLQVPPGHMVQQIVDEYGTLRHVVLSPQPQQNSVAGPFHVVMNEYAPQFVDANGSATFYNGYSVSPVPSNADMTAGMVDQNGDVGYHPNQSNYHQDQKENSFRRPSYRYQHHQQERIQNDRDGIENHQRIVPPRIGGRRRRPPIFNKSPTAVLNETNGRYPPNERFSAKSPLVHGDKPRFSTKFDGPNRKFRNSYQNSYSQPIPTGQYGPNPEALRDEVTVPSTIQIMPTAPEDEETSKISEMLSRIPPPKIREVTSTAVFVQWQPFDCSEASANGGSFPQIDASEFTYEVLLYKENLNDAPEQSYRCQAEIFPQIWLAGLKPASDYFIRLRASLDERGIAGEPSLALAFTTNAAAADKPDQPRLEEKSKTWLLVSWTTPCDNGSKIVEYHLEIYENGENFN